MLCADYGQYVCWCQVYSWCGGVDCYSTGLYLIIYKLIFVLMYMHVSWRIVSIFAGVSAFPLFQCPTPVSLPISGIRHCKKLVMLVHPLCNSLYPLYVCCQCLESSDHVWGLLIPYTCARLFGRKVSSYDCVIVGK